MGRCRYRWVGVGIDGRCGSAVVSVLYSVV